MLEMLNQEDIIETRLSDDKSELQFSACTDAAPFSWIYLNKDQVIELAEDLLKLAATMSDPPKG